MNENDIVNGYPLKIGIKINRRSHRFANPIKKLIIIMMFTHPKRPL